MAPAASPALPALALLFNAGVWGLSWIAFKALHQLGVHPLWSTALVYAGALAALLAWRPGGLLELGRHPKLLALAAAAGLTNVGFNWAVTVGDVVRVTLLFYLMPVLTIRRTLWRYFDHGTVLPSRVSSFRSTGSWAAMAGLRLETR